MTRSDPGIRIPPAAPPALPCSRCGGIYEQSVRLDDGTILRGHIPGGATCNPREAVLDKRERRRAFTPAKRRR